MDLVPLPGVLRKACEYHVLALAKSGTLQEREGDVPAHPVGVLAHHQVEALDRAGVVVWVPVVRDPALSGGAAAAASTRAQVVAAVGTPVDGSGRGIPYTPNCRRSLGVAGGENCPKGGWEWADHVTAVDEIVLQVLEGHRYSSYRV